MVPEREYRISCIERYSNEFAGKRIAVYGTGINAKLVVTYCAAARIVGLMDRSCEGETHFGLKVLTEGEVAALGVEVIIIGAKIDSAMAIYNRIKGFCQNNGIVVYDLYGNDIARLIDDVHRIKRSDMTSLNSLLIGYDGVSMKANGLLFQSALSEEEIFRKVWESRFTAGFDAYRELRSVYGKERPCDLRYIYSMIRERLCLSDKDAEGLEAAEIQERTDSARSRTEVLDAIKALVSSGKHVCLINDSPLPNEYLLSSLQRRGVDSDAIAVIGYATYSVDEVTGLYRIVRESLPGDRLAHVGLDYFKDGVSPAVYHTHGFVLAAEPETSASLIDNSTAVWAESTQDSVSSYTTDAAPYKIVENGVEGYVKLELPDGLSAYIAQGAQSTPGWLEQLVGAARRFPDADVICSKVVSRDGRVLYAGADVSALPQDSRFASGLMPVYDYLRDADAISNVAYLVRRGGDKPRKVLYQPFSMVTIDESMADRFAYDIEAPDHHPVRILVTDNLVPQFDKDAGSRCTWFYLHMFKDLGLDVTLMPQSFVETEPYATQLRRSGIRVLGGDCYRAHWREWVRQEGPSFSLVYMQRPESTGFFMGDFEDCCTRARIFYFAHDLHFLRLKRQYEITKDPAVLKESEDSKAEELRIFERADVIHVVGSYEQALLSQMLPGKIVRNIPLYLYENVPQPSAEEFARREGILFVGSFGHPPNNDAALWFGKEIFPRILQRHPHIVWHVVGTKPSDEVKGMAGDNIVLHGYVSDEELANIYRSCRIVVVPLRYGAGVKGKIVEASYYQTPIVTTPIGAEGIPQDEKNMLVCSNAEEFADAVSCLYDDVDELKRMADGGCRLVEKYYSKEAAERILRQDMGDLLP